MITLSHDPRRRLLLSAGGGLLLYGVFSPRSQATNEIIITMSGSSSGSHVWFRPRGLWVQPGQTVRWLNTEIGNVHTVTAYHPDYGKPQRIPEGVKPWNSNYLMPNESFVKVFETPGVYDYFCIPHEQAGMVGRVVVGEVDASVAPYRATDSKLPTQALVNLPSVSEIMKHTSVD